MSKKQEIEGMHQEYVMPTYAPGLALVKGEGCKVWDADGKEYLDFLAGISVLNVGHCHPKVVGAIRDQASKLMHVSNLYYNENQPKLAKALSERSLGGKCFFCNSGAEANEALIKLARKWGHDKGKYEVIAMRNSFHGRTLATLTATGQDKIQKGFDPLPVGFAYAEFNNLESCREAINEKTAAIIVEAVQGEGGIVPADEDFFKGLRALCDEKDILMLCDEVQCGMGRTGKWFGYQHYGVEPDAISLAKALGGGFPIGAIVTGEKLADVFQPGNHASTFGGTPLACAAALGVIEAMEDEDMLANANKVGEVFTALLGEIAEKHDWIEAVRGKGLMVGLVLSQPAKGLQTILEGKGVLALATAEKILRFLPPLNVDEATVRKVADIVKEACEEIAAKTGGSDQ